MTVFPYPGDDPASLSSMSFSVDGVRENMSTFASSLNEVKGQLGQAWTGDSSAKAQGDLGKLNAMLPTIVKDLTTAKSALDHLAAGLRPIRTEVDSLRTQYAKWEGQLQGAETTADAPRRGGQSASAYATAQQQAATDEAAARRHMAELQAEYERQVTKANTLTTTCQDALRTSSSGTARYDGSTLTSDSLATALGLDGNGFAFVHDDQMVALAKKYATELNAVNTTDHKGAAAYHQVATEIGPYMDDPAFAAAFVGDVGPQRMQLIPDFLYSSGSSTAGQDLANFSHVFGTAVSNDGLDPRVKQVEALFLTKPPEAETSWFRAAMCSNGTFPATFLASAARVNALDDFAQHGQEGFGGMGFRGEPNGMDFVRQMNLPSDVVAAWTQDLSTNPAAARDALATMGSSSSSVDISSIDPNTLTQDYASNVHKMMMYGSGDMVDGMGKAAGDLFVAASGANTPDGQHTPDEVNFAKGFFDNFGQHEKDGDAVPPVANADYAKIGGAYVQEMAAGSQQEGSSVGDVSTQLAGQTAQFAVPPDVAKSMMRSFVGDPTATHQFDEAAGAQYHQAQLAAARLDAGLPGNQAQNLNHTANAYGSVAGLENSATHDVLGERDEQAESDSELTRNILSAGIDLIPGEKLAEDVPGTVWDVAKHVANMGLEHAYGATGDARFDATTDASHTLALTDAYSNLAVLKQVGYPGTDSIPADLLDPTTHQLLPVTQILKNGDLQESLHNYLQSDGPAGQIHGTSTSVYDMTTNAGSNYSHGFDLNNG